MSSLPRVIVTCGPSYEPIDEVRRITNFSTGSLGMMLAGMLSQNGYQVLCLKGEGATTKAEAPGAEVVEFSTNDHLYSLLRELSSKEPVSAIFHAAALCDYKIQSIEADESKSVGKGKISSRAGELYMRLTPALKLISRLRPLFPSSQIFGWKYEVEGSPSEAIGKAHAQIAANQTTACIVNGPAYGDGFGFLTGSGNIYHLPTRAALCEYLLGRIQVQQ